MSLQCAPSILSLGSFALSLASLAQLAYASGYQVNWYSDANCQDYVASCEANGPDAGVTQAWCGVSNTVQSYVPLQGNLGGDFSVVDSTTVGEGKDKCQATGNLNFLGTSSKCYSLPSAYDGACLNWMCYQCADGEGPAPGKKKRAMEKFQG